VQAEKTRDGVTGIVPVFAESGPLQCRAAMKTSLLLALHLANHPTVASNSFLRWRIYAVADIVCEVVREWSGRSVIARATEAFPFGHKSFDHTTERRTASRKLTSLFTSAALSTWSSTEVIAPGHVLSVQYESDGFAILITMTTTYSAQDIAKHKVSEDAWITLHSKGTLV
jgi:hypothetical protein